MNGNAQCERCNSYSLPAFSDERICGACKEEIRPDLRALLDQQSTESGVKP